MRKYSGVIAAQIISGLSVHNASVVPNCPFG